MSTLASTPSATQTINDATVLYWLKDIATPANNMAIKVKAKSHIIRQTEQSTAHMALGRQNKVVISDNTIGGEDGSLTIFTLDAATYLTLRTLIESQDVLLLQDPYGFQWYIRIIGDRSQSHIAGALTLGRETTISYVQVDTP